MPFDTTTRVFTRVANSFSNPASNTIIAPDDADDLFSDYDDGLSDLAAGTREKLTADRTYYVRTNGSNSNNGRADTAGGAFLTLQYAVNVVINDLDLNGHNATIEITGAYTAGAVCSGNLVGSGTFKITSTNGATITVTGGDCIDAIAGCRVSIGGDITFSTVTSGVCLAAYANGMITTLSGLKFGATATGHIQAGCVSPATGFPTEGGLGTVRITGNYTITGGGGWHWHATAEGATIVVYPSLTITLSGTPAFSSFFAGVTAGLIFLPYGTLTMSGSATGPRYLCHNGGKILGANSRTFLPGDAVGTTSAGGLYNTSASETDNDFACADIFLHPSASLTPTSNGDLVIQATSNTSLTFKYKGSDGTVRSGSVTLS